MGDLNDTLNEEDIIGVYRAAMSEIEVFRNCVINCELEELHLVVISTHDQIDIKKGIKSSLSLREYAFIKIRFLIRQIYRLQLSGGVFDDSSILRSFNKNEGRKEDINQIM